jgi:glycerophosphoryl diester phosphodiesterase
VVRTAFFDSPYPRIFAHRGLSQHSENIDENSLEAFVSAIANGATHIESDVHATKDRVAVLFHDRTLERVAGIKKAISELTFAELSRITLVRGGSIPSLAQALELDVKFNLDIKTRRAIEPTVRVIEEYRAHQRVLVSSFSNSRRKRALKLLTEPVATSASVRQVLLAYLSSKLGGVGYASLVREIDAFQVPTGRGPIHFATERFIHLAQQHDVEVHFWTINDRSEKAKLLSIGADGIVTDRVDLLS